MVVVLGVKAVNLDGQPVTPRGERVRQVCWLVRICGEGRENIR